MPTTVIATLANNKVALSHHHNYEGLLIESDDNVRPLSNFFFVPRVWLESPFITRSMYHILNYFVSRPPGWIIKIKQLCKDLHMGREEFQNAMRKLKDIGLVHEIHKQDPITGHYTDRSFLLTPTVELQNHENIHIYIKHCYPGWKLRFQPTNSDKDPHRVTGYPSQGQPVAVNNSNNETNSNNEVVLRTTIYPLARVNSNSQNLGGNQKRLPPQGNVRLNRCVGKETSGLQKAQAIPLPQIGPAPAKAETISNAALIRQGIAKAQQQQTPQQSIPLPKEVHVPSWAKKLMDLHGLVHTYRGGQNTGTYKKSVTALKNLQKGVAFNRLSAARFKPYHNRKFTIDEITTVINRMIVACGLDYAPANKTYLKKLSVDFTVYDFINQSSLFLDYFENAPRQLNDKMLALMPDPDPTFTTYLRHHYKQAKGIGGSNGNGLTVLDENKLREGTKKAKDFWLTHKAHFAPIGLKAYAECVFEAIWRSPKVQEQAYKLYPAHFASDHSWQTLIPPYLNDQGVLN